MTSSEMTPADLAAVTNGGNNNGWGGDWSAWIIIFILFAAFGWGGNGNGLFGGGTSGAAENYVLASDFATLQRQIDSGNQSLERKLDNVNNGLCDGFYTQAQLVNGVNQSINNSGYETRIAINGIGSQMAQCCCDTREAISGVNYNLATQANNVSRQIENGFCNTNYNMATQNSQTLTAIDKVGDRIIDYLTAEKAQTLRDENQALRLAASQQAQNAYLVNQLRPYPSPAYIAPNPWASQTPYGCCASA